MNSIYSVGSAPASGGAALHPVWTQGASGTIAAGYTSLVPVQISGSVVLFAHNKAAQKTDVYMLSDSDPRVQRTHAQPDLAGGPWDIVSAFVLGNDSYLLTYRRDDGRFGFFRIVGDLSVSKPYSFALPRNTPTKGFSTVAPFTSLRQQYFLGYDFDTGVVATFNVAVTSSSVGGVPPLHARNVWYYRWAEGWTHFVFFQFGGANFFFKINTAKLNVNIDHIQDDPAQGTVEVGTGLQTQLADALSIDIAAAVPWDAGEPHLLTYIASNGATGVHLVHANCEGWTNLDVSTTVTGASQAVPFRIGGASYVLFYQG